MRVQRVVTNETCNQNCWFCDARRPSEDPDFVAQLAVRRRIAAACEGDTREIVLTGGEPTMRSDLADLVRRAGSSGREGCPGDQCGVDRRRPGPGVGRRGTRHRARPVGGVGRRSRRDHARPGWLRGRGARDPSTGGCGRSGRGDDADRAPQSEAGCGHSARARSQRAAGRVVGAHRSDRRAGSLGARVPRRDRARRHRGGGELPAGRRQRPARPGDVPPTLYLREADAGRAFVRAQPRQLVAPGLPTRRRMRGVPGKRPLPRIPGGGLRVGRGSDARSGDASTDCGAG